MQNLACALEPKRKKRDDSYLELRAKGEVATPVKKENS